jgi:thiopeptide-type bacteriocin biosynthesis protein
MNTIQRTFILGDQWLYLKLYTGYKTADHFLAEALPGMINQLKVEQVMDQWFFIRYLDPHYHLRIRFYLKDPVHSPALSVINQHIKPYVSQGLIWKVQADTYQRELERYGAETIEHAEAIFNSDSEAIVTILEMFKGNAAEQYLWLIALKMIDAFLDDFEFDIDDKLELISYLSGNFKREFGFTTKDYKMQLDKKFRANRKTINEIMTGASLDNWITPFSSVIQQKSQRIKPVAKTLLKLETQKTLQVSLNNLLASYLHMMINRLFRSKQRICEMVLYDTLERYYSSFKAKNKYNKEENKIFADTMQKAVTF